jgi:PAS domain S-box-containing protein
VTSSSDKIQDENCPHSLSAKSFSPPSANRDAGPGSVAGGEARGAREKTDISVLVVNDVPDLVALMKELLRQSGYDVLTAFDGQEGFEVARAEHPDLVISDVAMPRLDGIAMCRLIRAHPELRTIPVLLVSAKRKDSASVIEGLKAGADDYLELPYDPMRLITRVAQLIERKRAEDALRASEAKYRQIIETANEGIWMIDMEGKTLFANQRVAEMLGTTVDEFVGRSAFQFVFEEDLAEAQGRLEERRRGAFGQTEFRIRRTDNTSIYTLSNTSPLKNEAGEVIGILAMLSDITERRRSEESLRESEERFRSIFEGGPMGMAVVSLDAKFIQVNGAFCEVLGYTEREFLSRTFPEITHPEDVNADIRQAERLFKGEIDKYHLEKRFITKNGETVWANLTATLIRDREGRPMYGLGMIEDITERKQAEARLQEVVRSKEESLALLDTIISSAPIGFAFHNCDLTIERINEPLATIIGLTVEEHLGHTLHEIAPEVAEAVEPYFRQVLETGEPVLDIELSGKPFAAQGGQRYWLASFYPVRMQGGELLGIGALVSDITERKRIEERLKSSNEELRALSARLQLVREEESLRIAREIHDELGGALTGLKMDLYWLDKRLSEPAKATKQQKMRAMLELIDETIQKVRNIATELRPAILDDLGLAAAIEWQAREFQNRTEIECRIISLHEDVTISSEKATAVFRIFQELLTNVARHAGATLVEIRMEKQNGDVILEVSDNGRGIKESEMTNTKSLGLLGVRERTLVFGGRVHIARAEGKGTQVTIRIPLD